VGLVEETKAGGKEGKKVNNDIYLYRNKIQGNMLRP
jgi:hypothetical protein